VAAGALRALHTFRYEAVLSRTVKWLALRTNCLACASVQLALLHEAHFSSAVKGFPFALIALSSQDCAAAVPTARQAINSARTIRLTNPSLKLTPKEARRPL
jgi:hypothetical protein